MKHHIREVKGDDKPFKVCTEGKVIVGSTVKKKDAERMIKRLDKK